MLAFVAGNLDITSPYDVTVAMLPDLKAQAPQAMCDLEPGNVSCNLLVNRDKPPFNNPDLRRAMALALDRKSFVDIVTDGKGDMGGVMQPPPEGLWGMPPGVLQSLPGYSSDVGKSRAEARALIEKLGYSAANRLKVKVSSRNRPTRRRP
jgi:peptide/nickel transport system substrate-binding protein